MSFFQQLPDTAKHQILESSRNNLATELISLLLRYGVDPETFDIEDTSSVGTIMVAPDLVRVEQISDGLKVIATKLAALGG